MKYQEKNFYCKKAVVKKKLNQNAESYMQDHWMSLKT